MAALRGEPQPLVLRRVGARLSRRDRTIIVVLVTGAFIGLAWVLWPLRLDPGAIVEVLLELLAAVALGWYMARAARYERLTLDRAGIHYQSPLPGFLSALQPSWSHAWAQIRAAQIVVPRLAGDAALAAIVLDALTAKRRLSALWVDADEVPRDFLFKARFQRSTTQDIAAEVQASPLVEYLRHRGVKIEVSAAPGIQGFKLESNRATFAASVAVVGLIVYAVADLMFKTEAYAVEPAVQVFVLAGAGAFLVAALALAAARVPGPETVGVALLFGCAFGFALYPGALRLNQLTDTEGLRASPYRMKQHVLWEPRDDTLPALRFNDFHEYWQEYKPGAEREFLLRRGALGFWQVELAPVREEMKAFYRR